MLPPSASGINTKLCDISKKLLAFKTTTTNKEGLGFYVSRRNKVKVIWRYK